MHVRVGTPGVNIPTGVPYPEPSYVVITVPRPQPSTSAFASASASGSPSSSVATTKKNGKKPCMRSHAHHEPTFTIQTDPPYPEPTFTANSAGELRRHSRQADVPVPESTLGINDRPRSGTVGESENREEARHDRQDQESSWPDHCHPPFCFQTAPGPEAEAETGIDVSQAFGNGRPRGGLVRGEAKIGSVKLNL